MTDDVISALRNALTKFNENHDGHGRFAPGSGGGSGSSAKPSLRDRASAAREWVRGKSAGEVIAAAAANHGLREKAKEGLSFAIQSLISHGTGLDASTWKLNEAVVDHVVHDFSTIAHATAMQSKQAIVSTLNSLISARQKQVEARMRSDDEPIEGKQTHRLSDLEMHDDPVLDILMRCRDAVAAANVKQTDQLADLYQSAANKIRSIITKATMPTVVAEYLANLAACGDDKARFTAVFTQLLSDDRVGHSDLIVLASRFAAIGYASMMAPDLFNEISRLFSSVTAKKSNDNHDERGRFAEGPGGGAGGAPFQPRGSFPATGIPIVDHHVSELAAAGNSREKFDAAVSALKADKSVDKVALTKISQTYGLHVYSRLNKEGLYKEIQSSFIENARFINKLRSSEVGMMIKSKDFVLQVKSLDEAGALEGYASMFGNRDTTNEVVMRGAFDDSLARHKREGTYPLMLWQHNSNEPIGVWDDLSDDGKGLFAKGRLLINQGVPEADKAHALLKAGAVRGMSIGYREIDTEPSTNNEPRKLLKLDLLEASIVSFPANRRAMVEAVKSDDEDRAIKFWKRLEIMARKFRDGEPLPAKEYEEILREAGFPKSVAVQIASVGYVKSIRSESGGDEAKTAIARLRDAARAFSNPG